MNRRDEYLQTFITQFVCLFLGVFSSVLASRCLLPEGRGQMGAIQYYPTLLGTFFPLAVPQAITLFMSADPKRSDIYSRAGIQISLLLSLLGVILFTIFSPFTLSVKNSYLIRPVVIACLAAAPMVFIPSIQAIYRGDQQFNWINRSLIIVAVLYPINLSVLWFLGRLTPLNAVLAGFVGNYLVCGLGVIGKIKQWRAVRVNLQDYKDLLIQGIRFFGPVLAILLFQMSDRALLMNLTNLKQLGFYVVAYSATYPLTLVTEPFLQIGFVEIASQNSIENKQSIFLRRFKLAQVILLPMFFLMGMFLYPFIRFLQGSEFIPAIYPAYICLIAMFIKSLSRYWENSLRTVNLNRTSIFANIFSLVLMAGLAYCFVPNYGVIGFSIILGLVELFKLVFMIYYSKQIFISGSLKTIFFNRSDIELVLEHVKEVVSKMRKSTTRARE